MPLIYPWEDISTALRRAGVSPDLLSADYPAYSGDVVAATVAADAAGGRFVVSRSVYAVNADVTFGSATSPFRPLAGCVLRPPAGRTYTVTLADGIPGNLPFIDLSSGGHICIEKPVPSRICARNFVGCLMDGIHDDTAALNALMQTAFGWTGGPHGVGTAHQTWNVPVWLNQGQAILTDEVLVPPVRGWHIHGAGALATTLTQTVANKCAIRFNGCSYGSMGELYVNTTQPQDATHPLIDCDYDNSGLSSGHQRMTFVQLLVDCGWNAQYGFKMARSGYQGDTSTFISCGFTHSTVAGYAQDGYNALCNTFIGCDSQGNLTDGYNITGSASWLDCTFENFYSAAGARTAAQIDTGGFDIRLVVSAGNTCEIRNARSESWKFLKVNGASMAVNVSGVTMHPNCLTWQANHAYALDELCTGTATTVAGGMGDGKLYKCTVAGVSSAVAQPVWPGTGTIVDGGVTWTYVDFDVLDTYYGTHIDNGWFPLGRLKRPAVGGRYEDTLTLTRCGFSRYDFCRTAVAGYPEKYGWLNASGLNPGAELDNCHVYLGATYWRNPGSAYDWLVQYDTVAEAASHGFALKAYRTAKHLGSTPILWECGMNGATPGTVGFVPVPWSGASGVGTHKDLLELIGVLSRTPPIGVADTAGLDVRVGGGPGTGTGVGGKVLLLTAPAGGAGSTVNTLTVAAQIDADRTAGNTPLWLLDGNTGILKRVQLSAAGAIPELPANAKALYVI